MSSPCITVEQKDKFAHRNSSDGRMRCAKAPAGRCPVFKNDGLCFVEYPEFSNQAGDIFVFIVTEEGRIAAVAPARCKADNIGVGVLVHAYICPGSRRVTMIFSHCGQYRISFRVVILAYWRESTDGISIHKATDGRIDTVRVARSMNRVPANGESDFPACGCGISELKGGDGYALIAIAHACNSEDDRVLTRRYGRGCERLELLSSNTGRKRGVCRR